MKYVIRVRRMVNIVYLSFMLICFMSYAHRLLQVVEWTIGKKRFEFSLKNM